MSRIISYNRNDLASVLSALETVSAFYADDKMRWEKERRALQKQVSLHVQLRDARARVALLEHVIADVHLWHGSLFKDGGGYHADLHTILLRAKRDRDDVGP